MSKNVSRFGVTWNADKIRILRWTSKARIEFEEEFIKTMGLDKSANVDTRTILFNMIDRTGILNLALFYALRHEDPDLTLEKIIGTDATKDKDGKIIPATLGLIDLFAEKGGDLKEIKEKLQEAILIAVDNSYLPFWRENLKNLSDITDLERKVMETRKKILVSKNEAANQIYEKTMKQITAVLEAGEEKSISG